LHRLTDVFGSNSQTPTASLYDIDGSDLWQRDREVNFPPEDVAEMIQAIEEG